VEIRVLNYTWFVHPRTERDDEISGMTLTTSTVDLVSDDNTNSAIVMVSSPCVGPRAEHGITSMGRLRHVDNIQHTQQEALGRF
jgi:hypothetical protein